MPISDLDFTKKFTKEKCPTKMPKPTYFSFLRDIDKIV